MAQITDTDTDPKQVEIDQILAHPFVRDLLKLLADIRTAVGDTEGTLSHSELVAKCKGEYTPS